MFILCMVLQLLIRFGEDSVTRCNSGEMELKSKPSDAVLS